MKKVSVMVVMAVLVAFITTQVWAEGDTYVDADVFSPSNLNLDGVDNSVSYFPTDILGAKSSANLSVNGAAIGAARFSGKVWNVIYQKDEYAVALTHSKVNSNAWMDGFGGEMTTWGHWTTLSGAYRVNPQLKVGLAIGLDGESLSRTVTPLYMDFSSSTIDDRTTENTNFVLGAEWSIDQNSSIVGAYGKRRTSFASRTTYDDGSDPEQMESFQFEETRMTVAAKYKKDKFGGIVGFQGREDEFLPYQTETLRTFIGINYQCSEDISVHAGSCNGSRDIGVTLGYTDWTINAAYLHNGIETDNQNSKWTLGVGKEF